MSRFDPVVYGPVLAPLLSESKLNELGPGSPKAAVRPSLAALSIPEAFTPHSVRDPMMARACLAALWLQHDFLEESHALSQEIATPSGSYWHGLMHRREPDFANAKYWFRRVGDHPVFQTLHPEAARLAEENGEHASAAFLTTQPAWDPFAFIDLCEVGLGSASAVEMLCRRIQQREWQLLFEFCYQHAVAQAG